MSSPVILALDVPTLDEARALAREVAPAIGMIKVGLELFVEAGPLAVKLGTEVDRPVFLDLKLHDIPETVDRAVARALDLGASLITVHASGGPEMLRRAVKRAEAAGKPDAICAVTILTSLDDQDLARIGLTRSADPQATRKVPAFNEASARRSEASHVAERLAVMAAEEGVRSFVCSAVEVADLKKRLPQSRLVTPGIRPAGGSDRAGDQKRIATPEQAIRDGADWLVVGRPIRDASDRLAAARAITDAALAARR